MGSRGLVQVLTFAALAGASACGDGDGDEATRDGATDAGEPRDALVDAPATELQRIDLRGMRGAPIATTAVELTGSERVFAAGTHGFATHAACVDGRCDYAWYDLAGTRVRVRPHLAAFTATSVSPDGGRMLVVDEAARDVCGPDRKLVLDGHLEVVDLADGRALLSVPARTNSWAIPGWGGYGRWFVDGSLPTGACEGLIGLRRAVAPFARALLPADVEPLAELPDGLWVAERTGIGVVDPARADGYVPWPDDVEDDRVAGGWLHASGGFGDGVERVHARPPGGPDRAIAVPDGDRFYRTGPSWGRVALVCAPQSNTTGLATCTVLDLDGVRPPRELAYTVRRAPQVAVLGGGRAIVAENEDAGDAPRFERVDLETGARDVVAQGAATLTPLGDGEAAILVHAGGALLVEATRVEPLTTGQIDQVIVLPPPAGSPRLAHHGLAVLVENLGDGGRRLLLLDLDRRELLTITDALYHAPHLQYPLAFDDCGQPWTLRTAGLPFEQAWQPARWFFFTELPPAPGQPFPLFVMPLDRSAPPRALGDAGLAPVNCHAPLASADGTRLVLPVDVDGTRTHVRLAAP